MSAVGRSRGGASVGVLSQLEPWEANLVLNLRLWCDGPNGQAAVWSEYRRAFAGQRAQKECRAFEDLLHALLDNAHRPLVRRQVGCACVGVDESVIVNLIGTAADGNLTDAVLIATLLVGPGKAELIALLAGEVGSCMRQIHSAYSRMPQGVQRDAVRYH